MFTILNRLRGTWGIFAHITGILLGLLAYVLSDNFTMSLMITVGYVLGESFGWGKWIGGIIHGIEKADDNVVADEEGRKNGIHWIANWIAPERDNYQDYCKVALTIRGFYWAFLTLLPLLIFGYIGYFTFMIISLLIGIGFPLSVIIGKYTAKKFNFIYSHFNMVGAWEHAEVWYGLMQDMALVYLIFMI